MTSEGVRITLREVYDRVAGVEAKVDLLVARDRSDDHEARIRKVERWVAALPPTLLLALVSIAVALRG